MYACMVHVRCTCIQLVHVTVRHIFICLSHLASHGSLAVVFYLSPKGYVVSCRFHSALIVFLSAMSSVVHYEGRGMKV